jgi:hypothetical protein
LVVLFSLAGRKKKGRFRKKKKKKGRADFFFLDFSGWVVFRIDSAILHLLSGIVLGEGTGNAQEERMLIRLVRQRLARSMVENEAARR